jgi:hypothetical protein
MEAPTTNEFGGREPTVGQLERAARLRRFNLFAVYAPIVTAVALALALVIWLLILGLPASAEGSRVTVSAVANAVVILLTLPLLLLCAALPLALLALMFQSRRRGISLSAGTQRLFWRLDSLVARIAAGTDRASLVAVRPFVTWHAWLAYVASLVRRVSSFGPRR